MYISINLLLDNLILNSHIFSSVIRLFLFECGSSGAKKGLEDVKQWCVMLCSNHREILKKEKAQGGTEAVPPYLYAFYSPFVLVESHIYHAISMSMVQLVTFEQHSMYTSTLKKSLKQNKFKN